MNRGKINITNKSLSFAAFKKAMEDKAAIHEKIRNGESTKDIRKQRGIVFATPI